MFTPPFCPYRDCTLHTNPPATMWWSLNGTHETRAFGTVQRFKCDQCHHTFSTQTFSVHYYAKRVLNLRKLEGLGSSSMSVRALSRHFHCTCGTITNREDRIARQGVALHATLRKTATRDEAICFDGLVSFDQSQYFPSDIGLSITAESRFILAATHATTRRSGTMRPAQKAMRDRLYAGMIFERKAVERSFTEHLDMFAKERCISTTRPLILVTDEKIEYERAFKKHELYRNQRNDRRCVRVRVSSTLPRTIYNPLFASNYLDRETRKDQANHRRETTCFSRSPANSMSRLYSYLVWHNYEKRYLIKGPKLANQTAAEIAGVPRHLVRKMRTCMFTQRAFLSHLSLEAADLKIWTKRAYCPKAGALVSSKLPAFAYG